MPRFAAILLLTLAISPLSVPLQAAEEKKPTLSIHFLSKKDAMAAIVQEKIEPYFALMTPLDMNAKIAEPIEVTADGAFLPAIKKQYQQAILDFTPAEKAAITACLTELEPTFAKHFPLLLKTPWRFIKKANTLESGAHFTREDCVVLSENFTRAAVQWHERLNNGKIKQAAFTLHIARLLLHEQTHVLQRLHPEGFAELYKEQWHFIRVTDIKDDPWLKERRAVNPDGVDLGWVFPLEETTDGKTTTRYFWTQVLYTKTDGRLRLFRDTVMAAVELEKTEGGFKVRKHDKDDKDDNGTPIHHPLQSLRSYTAKFPFGGAYHPNEAAAGVLPRVILSQHIPLKSTDEKALARDRQLAPFRDWARKYLK